MDDYDEHGFPVETDWPDNAIGVDTESCQCTDCLIGASVPFDSPRMLTLAAAAVTGRKIVNRTNRPLVLVEAFDGVTRFEEVAAYAILGTYPVM